MDGIRRESPVSRSGHEGLVRLRLGGARGHHQGPGPDDKYAHHLLIQRSKETEKRKGKPAMHEIEYFLVRAPDNAPVPRMIRAAGLRCKIEQDNQNGKDQLGLDHYRARKYTPGIGTSPWP